MRPTLEYVSSVWSPLPSSTSINCKSCRIENCYRMLTRHNICMTKHSHFPYTSTYSSTPHNANGKHNIHHTHTTYFNTSRLKHLYTTGVPTDAHTVTTTGIKTNMRHIRLLSLATIGNDKILRTHPPRISNSEEILPRLTLAQLGTNTNHYAPLQHPPSLQLHPHMTDATGIG